MLKTLFLKEIVLLVALTGVGAGLAAHLRSDKLPGVCRLAIAPALGLAVSAPVLMSLNFFVPLRHALWFAVLPAAAVSLAVALRALRMEGGPRVTLPPPRQLAQLAVIGAALFFALNHTIDVRNSHGPIGYGIFDGPGYITYIQGYTDFTNEKPLAEPAPNDDVQRPAGIGWGDAWDISLRYGWALKFQHTAAQTVPAVVGGAAGWPPWQMLTPFMVVLLMIGALGVYALTVTFGGRRAEWPGVLAALAFAGPVTFQVFIDGSAGLLSGLALLPAIFVVGLRALEVPRKTLTVLLGAMLAGLQAVYPELLALPAAAAVLVVLALGVHRRRLGRLTRSIALRAVGHLSLLGASALLLSPRTAPWTLNYLYDQISRQTLFGGLIEYDMGIEYLPGWLAQTREFYSFAIGPQQELPVLVGLVLPIVLIGVAAFGVRRFAWSRLLLAFLVVVAAQAYLTGRSLDCSYCTQRSLVALTPVIPVLVALGVAALATNGRRWGRYSAMVIGVTTVIAVGVTMEQSLSRATAGAYTGSTNLEPLASEVRQEVDGPLHLEGFAAPPFWAWAEQPTTYAAMNQATDQRLSTVATYNDYGGFTYTQTRPVGHPVYTPRYRYVLTRFGSLDSGREEIARRGPLRLMRRATPFDVVVARGAAVDKESADPAGLAWVQSSSEQLGYPQLGFEQGRLTFWISALTPRRAFLRLTLAAPPELSVTDPAGAVVRPLPEGRFDVCLPVQGSGGLRIQSVGLEPPTGPLLPSGEALDPVPRPAQAIRLDAALASSRPCETAGAPPVG